MALNNLRMNYFLFTIVFYYNIHNQFISFEEHRKYLGFDFFVVVVFIPFNLTRN